MPSAPAPFLVNRIYPLGASFSPEPVFVTRVDSSAGYAGRGIVFFHALEHRAVEQRMELPVFRSLCETAMRTKLDRIARWERGERTGGLPLPEHMKREREHYALFLAGSNTMPELNPAEYAPATFEPMQVRVSVATPEAFDKANGRSGDPYYAAEAFGGVMIPNEHPSHYVIYVARRDIPKISADTRFKIEEIVPEFPSEGKENDLPSDSVSAIKKA
jgi:hypothetical protein